MGPLESLKEIATAINNQEIVAEDDKGNKLGLSEAMSKGLKVSLTSGKKKAIEEFKKAFNIDLEDKEQVNQLNRILSELNGGKESRTTKSSGGDKRQTYTNADKVGLIKKWLEVKESGLSKKSFCEENDLQYPTFNSWLKKNDIMKKVK